jgi:hypothetical protein
VVHFAEVHFRRCFNLSDCPIQSGITLAQYDKQLRHTRPRPLWREL